MAEDVKTRKYSIDKVRAVMTSPVPDDGKFTDGENVNAQMSRDVNDRFRNGSDFVVFNDDKDVCLTSRFRNVSVMFEGMVSIFDLDPKEAENNFNYVIDLFIEADRAYESSDNVDAVRGIVYFNIMRDIYEAQMNKEELQKTIQTKQEAKRAAKDAVKDKWFKIGQYYCLKKFGLNGVLKDVHVFRCVKFIYTVGNNPVNCVIMQKIGEPLNGNARTLSRMDCHLWHIKYSPDLYMFPMSQRFYTANQKEIDAALKDQASRQEQENNRQIADSQQRWTQEIMNGTEDKTSENTDDNVKLEDYTLMAGSLEDQKTKQFFEDCQRRWVIEKSMSEERQKSEDKVDISDEYFKRAIDSVIL